MSTLLLSFTLLFAPTTTTAAAEEGEPIVIGGQTYEKLATRQATLARMRDRLVPEKGDWGDWHLLTPFPYDGHGTGDIYTPRGPEDQLAAMQLGGPGPDLSRAHVGKNGVECRWTKLEDVPGRRVDMLVHDDEQLNNNGIAYLHATVDSATAQTHELLMGSDDGLLIWLNGRLIWEVDEPRGLNPFGDRVRFDLAPGTNHVLFKVSQGGGGWDFQISTRGTIDSVTDAHLFYQLERDFPSSREREHYRILTHPIPEDTVLEVGGLAFYGEDARPVVTTRRGDVFVVENAYDEPPLDAKFVPFATGLHEALGAGVRVDEDGEAIYVVQRGELTRLRDTDGDDRADVYETFNDDWGVSGNYHEFAFGPKFDRHGNAWVTLNVGFCGSLGKAVVPNRGACLKIDPSGKTTWVCDGLRSPNGIAEWGDGAMFYVDNQGDYIATNRLSWLKPGSWHGHPASLRWRTDLKEGELPPRQPASVWLPYDKVGRSASDIALDTTGGSFGPFENQFFVGDQFHPIVTRVTLEIVNGHYQGACYPFLEGFACGNNRLAFAPDGSLFSGQTDRGWTSTGRKRYGLERAVYTGVLPFEMHEVTATEDGFRIRFTKDVDRATAGDVRSYGATSWTYAYHPEYGAPEDDKRPLVIPEVVVEGPRTVRLKVDPFRKGYVHELRAPGVRAADGEALLHDVAWYTLIEVPGQETARAASDVGGDDGELPRVLLCTQSSGFTHGVVKRADDGGLSLVEKTMLAATAGRFELTTTQDASTIDAAMLAETDAVVFYTTGELPMGDNLGVMLDWIAKGGAFVGIHCATDTFYKQARYQQMIGGVFDGHPWNQRVRVSVDDPSHPATDHLGSAFVIADEIYQYRGFERHPTHVLLSLARDGEEAADLSRGKRADGDYALAWWKDHGEGRVFYTALGHRPEVWNDPRFRDHLLDGLSWAIDGEDHPAPMPSGAVSLSTLAAWSTRAGDGAQWTPLPEGPGGGFEVAAGEGDIVTNLEFSDFLLHLEFMTPDSPEDARGQARGNSGVYLLDRYELQVLDSYGLESKANDCAAIYSTKAPDVNASRPPGRWQSYDIRFTAPRFDVAGNETAHARITAWHNGLLVHDDFELERPTGGARSMREVPRGPIRLQDHGNPVRYRNLWIIPAR